MEVGIQAWNDRWPEPVWRAGNNEVVSVLYEVEQVKGEKEHVGV